MTPRGLALAWALLAAPAAARAAGEVPVEKRTLVGTDKEFCNEPRTIWCGREREIPFSLLARTRAAPVLWFSPDEPLIRHENRKRKVPQPIRCENRDPLDITPGNDEPAVVYYQVSQVLLGGPASEHQSARATLRAQKLPVFALRKLTLKYFFYYEEDVGFSAHVHDLEGIELQVEVEAHKSIVGLRRFRLLSVKGNAHGSDWQANVLQVPDDAILPLTILVEEGKHASCPDRNGDGLYTPGYDVNVRTHDAWGVRDIFGSRFAGSFYRPEQFKPRLCKPREFGPRAAAELDQGATDADSTDCPYRVGPSTAEAPPAQAPTATRWQAYEEHGLKPPTAEGYELRSAHELTPCQSAKSQPLDRGPTFFDIGKRMREVRFGELEPEVHTGKPTFRYGRPLILQPLRALAFGASEGGHAAASLSVYSPDELQIFGGWPFLRGGLTFGAPHELTLEAGYTPSISRLSDWYATAGFRRTSIAAENGAHAAWDWRTEAEVGLQVKWRALGFRLGGRARISHFRVKEGRVVLELVMGPFPGGSARGKE